MRLRNRKFYVVMMTVLTITSASYARISIIGGLSHEKKAAVGEVYKGSIIIKNDDTKAQEIKLYQTDYTFQCDGTNEYGEAGGLERSNAKWLSFSPNRMVIPSESTMTVNYTVKVPGGDPNLAGTYWSMLMVEEIPETSPESSQAEEVIPQVGIMQIVRYGVQMITHIEDTGERKLEFLDTKLLREEEVRILKVDVGNTGQRWLRASLWVELYDDAGRYIGRFENDRKRIFPGASVRFKVDLSNVPKGSYQSLVVADCGGDDIFGANLTLKFDE